MVRILFNGHDFKFLNHLISHCEQDRDYQVTMDYIPGHEMSHIEQSRPLLENADLIFCEWALGNAEWYSMNKRPGQKLVIRLHHQEINLGFLHRIAWENVDAIIFICPENMEIFLRRFPVMKDRTKLIYNVIDCKDLGREKQEGAFFNLGFIGTSPMRKSPHVAVSLFAKLWQEDNRFMLFIKGKHPWEYPWLWRRQEERSYYEALYRRINESEFAQSVVFDPHGNDMSEWFSKIGFILSTSEHEGSHQAVAEGMAAGSIPIIRNWAGADKLYPARFVVRNLEEASEKINSYRDPELFIAEREMIKQFAGEHFDAPVIISSYELLFRELLGPGRTRNVFNAEPIPAATPATCRVAHVCYLAPGSQSGYEVRVVEETKALVRQGVEVYIVAYFAPKWLQEPEKLETYRQNLGRMTGATVTLFPSHRFFDLQDSDAMLAEIDQPLADLCRLHDIRILHGQALYSARHAIRVAKAISAFSVFDVHGVSPEEIAMTGGAPARVERTTQFERDALVAADLNIMVSDRMSGFYHEKYNTGDLCHQLVPCCVRSRDFGITDQERLRIRKDKGFDDRFVMLYLGTLSAWQWPEAMFNLFSHFLKMKPNGIIYLLIPSYDHAKVYEFLEKYEIPGTSCILEEVPHSEVGRLIGIADAGVLLRESHPVNLVSSPTKFGEYLAAGVPVILTEGIGDYSALAGEQKVGICLAIDGDTFPAGEQQRFLAFVDSVERERVAWRDHCYMVASNQLDWAVYAEKIADRYLQLLKAGSSC